MLACIWAQLRTQSYNTIECIPFHSISFIEFWTPVHKEGKRKKWMKNETKTKLGLVWSIASFDEINLIKYAICNPVKFSMDRVLHISIH